MIESLSISKVATYPETPEIMNGLKSLNFIFGSNGTGDVPPFSVTLGFRVRGLI